MTTHDWASYDAVADIYESISVPHYFQGPAEHLVSLLGLARSDVLLDVGTGTGIVAATALRTAATVVALDASLRMLRRAKGAAPVLAAASALPGLPIPSASCSCATASFVLNHLSDPVGAMADVSRVLRPSGRAGVTSWAIGPSENEIGHVWSDTAQVFLDQAVIAKEVQRGLPGEERLADPDALAQVLSSAGFLVRALTQQEFRVGISVEHYLASRSISMTARLMRSRVPEASWCHFQATVADRFRQQFGEWLEFPVCVNFAVGTKGEPS